MNDGAKTAKEILEEQIALCRAYIDPAYEALARADIDLTYGAAIEMAQVDLAELFGVATRPADEIARILGVDAGRMDAATLLGAATAEDALLGILGKANAAGTVIEDIAGVDSYLHGLYRKANQGEE